MKKTLLLALFMLIIVFILTACGDNTDSSDDSSDTQTESQMDIQEDQQEKGTIPTTNGETILDDTQPFDKVENKTEKGEQTEMKLNVQIGDYNFTATLEKNAAVQEFVEMMNEAPVIIQMDDYSGFEKVGSLGRSLTTSNSQTTTVAGDIVLYNGSNIVMFYGSNSWSYTRIGKIDDLNDWEKALGSGSITAVFTIAE